MTKEELYQQAIAGAMEAIYKLCMEYDISFVASFQLDDEGDEVMFAHTCRLHTDAHERLIAMAELQDDDALPTTAIPVMGEVESSHGAIKWRQQPVVD